MGSDGSRRIGAAGDLPLTDAESAAQSVPDDAALLVSGFGSVGYPKAVPQTLADSGRDLSLTVVSGGSVGEEIDVALVEADAVERRYPFQARPAIREAVNDGRVAFADRHVSGVGDEVRYGRLLDPAAASEDASDGGVTDEDASDDRGTDEDARDGARTAVAVVEAVAVGEDWLIPSTSVGQTPAFVERADRLIVEVNSAQPRSLERFHDIYRPGTPPNREPLPVGDPGERVGSPRVEFAPEKLVAVVETDRRDAPYEFRDPTADDRGVANNLRGFLEAEVERSRLFADSVRLQFGVGSLGNALMGALGDADFGDRDLVYFGEVIQDGLLDLLDEGLLRSASATSLALSREGQNRLFAEADRYAEDVVLRPTDVSNSPALIDRFGVVAVNSALEVDVYGHVNSTNVGGSRMVNGVGGSGDFARNAALSILALPSTAGDGDVSRVVPMVPHVDHTEHDVDAVVTEQGVADLRGAAPRERAELLVEECAHPDFRGRLRAYLDRAREGGGHLPHDLGAAFSWRK